MRINRKNYSPEQFPGVHGFLRWNARECKGSIVRKEREKRRGREERQNCSRKGLRESLHRVRMIAHL